jgi:hypothetical protein
MLSGFRFVRKIAKTTVIFIISVCPSLFPHLCLPIRPSVRIKQLGFAERIFIKFEIGRFLENVFKKIKNLLKSDNNNGNFT